MDMTKMTAPSLARRLLIALPAVTIACVLVLESQSSSASYQEAAVKESFEAAVVAEQSVDAVYPDTRKPLEKATLKLQELGNQRALARLPDPAALARRNAQAGKDLTDAFAGKQLLVEKRLLDEAVAGRTDSEYTHSGGADEFKYFAVSVDGTSAQVSASARTWKTFVHQGNGFMDVASPDNVIMIDAKLEFVDQKWKVTELLWEFAPGEAP